ncbi:MAG: hypothetical protein Q7J20_04140, partial [Candidatus Nitrotoga sp.]|nr:hypothetical protein [Candidatus Nitrotoga sp.]
TAASILAPTSSPSFLLRRIQPQAHKLPFGQLRHVTNQETVCTTRFSSAACISKSGQCASVLAVASPSSVLTQSQRP